MKTITFKTYSLGCRANQAEMNDLADKLYKEGFTPGEKNLHLLLINTCAVTGQAEKDTRKAINKLKRAYPKAYVVVLGCGIDAKEKLKINLPKADLFVSNKNKEIVLKLIQEKFKSHPVKQKPKANKYQNSGRSLVKIQDGCNKFCTYCIVPLLRGKPKNKEVEKIIEDIKILEKESVKEIILTGINLSLYQNLPRLLKKILDETKIPRITLSSLTPEIIDQNLINLFVENERLSRFFHLSLQSGSEKVLKDMRRDNDLKKLINLLKEIKEKVPEFVLRADIIVGFPGETEEDFKATLQLIKLAKISFVHAFCFSKRPGTFAFEKIKNGDWKDLPEKLKKKRLNEVIKTTEEIRNEEAKNLIGKNLECLVIKKLKSGDYETLASNSWKAILQSKEKILSGQMKKLKILSFEPKYLVGEIT